MRIRIFIYIIVILILISGLLFVFPGFKFFKKFFGKKVSPHEMFAKAEELRKSGYLIEAAEEYDELFDLYNDSELAAAALYNSGDCKYILSIQCPGKQEFAQRTGLSDIKKKQYTDCVDYMEKQKHVFVYGEAIDKYIYTGDEFKTLIEHYPASNLVDDAAFQFVRTQIVEQQRTNTLTVERAFQLYAEIFEKYPQSPLHQKGIEDLVKIITEYSEEITNNDSVAAIYQRIDQSTENMPERSKLSYLLGRKLLEQKDTKNAAIIFGVPSVVGIGIVDTKQTRLNIRGGPGTNHRIVAKAEKGEEVLLLEETNAQWYQVRLQNGTVGYAHNDFIRKE